MAKKQRIDYTTDDIALAAKVEEGIPVVDVVAFGREVGFTTEQLARLVRIPSRTYARRVAGQKRLKVDESERAVRIMRLYDRAKQVLGTNERARLWLNRPLRVLGGRTPLDFAITEPGAREAEAVLGRFEGSVIS
jgi:putative toxin-antitoxin system antitoxin component (TIGR02293 family)